MRGFIPDESRRGMKPRGVFCSGLSWPSVPGGADVRRSPAGSTARRRSDGLGEGAAQGAGVASGADGAQGLHLDLAGPLLAYAGGLGDLAQGAGLAAVEAVAHLDDLRLALGQRLDRLDERHLPLADLDAGVVFAAPLVGEHLPHLRAVLRTHLRVDGGDRLADLAQTPGLLGLHVEPVGELLLRGVAAELEAQRVLRAAEAVERVDDVGGKADRAGAVGDGAGDGLADPPRRVRREAVAHLRVELLDGPDQAGVALLDQVLEEHAATPVLLGDRDHEPQVALDKPPPRRRVALARATAEVLHLLGIQELAVPDPAEVLCENVLRHPIHPYSPSVCSVYAAGYEPPARGPACITKRSSTRSSRLEVIRQLRPHAHPKPSRRRSPGSASADSLKARRQHVGKDRKSVV